MKKIVIVQGNPVRGSYGEALAAAYAQGASASGAEVKVIQVADLQFDPNLSGGFRDKQPLEEDLIAAQQSIQWADHMVFVFPTWWGGMPALLKGFIDRVFLPGFAFRYREKSPLPEQLLNGKTARIIITMDGPVWYNRFFQGKPGERMLKKATLQFCGVKPVRVTSIGTVRSLKDHGRQSWLDRVEQIGRKLV